MPRLSSRPGLACEVDSRQAAYAGAAIEAGSKETIERVRQGAMGDYMVSSSIGNVMAQVACYTGTGMTREECLKSDFTLGPKPEACSLDMDPPVKPDRNGIYPVPIPGVTTMD